MRWCYDNEANPCSVVPCRGLPRPLLESLLLKCWKSTWFLARCVFVFKRIRTKNIQFVTVRELSRDKYKRRNLTWSALKVVWVRHRREFIYSACPYNAVSKYLCSHFTVYYYFQYNQWQYKKNATFGGEFCMKTEKKFTFFDCRKYILFDVCINWWIIATWYVKVVLLHAIRTSINVADNFFLRHGLLRCVELNVTKTCKSFSRSNYNDSSRCHQVIKYRKMR